MNDASIRTEYIVLHPSGERCYYRTYLPEKPNLWQIRLLIEPHLIIPGQHEGIDYVDLRYADQPACLFTREAAPLDGSPRNELATNISQLSRYRKCAARKTRTVPAICGVAVLFTRSLGIVNLQLPFRKVPVFSVSPSSPKHQERRQNLALRRQLEIEQAACQEQKSPGSEEQPT